MGCQTDARAGQAVYLHDDNVIPARWQQQAPAVRRAEASARRR